MSNILQSIYETMEVYQVTYPEDACLILADTEKVLKYLPGKKIDLKVPVGAPASAFKGSVSEKALLTGKVTREERGPEKFGIAYITLSTPIFEEGQVVGVMSVTTSNQKYQTLRTGADELTQIVEEMAATTDQVAHTSSEVSARIQELAAESESMTQNMENIQSLLKLVQDVAAQSHLLGLNAAIEAARAGEHGRGFSIVASEIRKMAENSKQSVKDIQEQIGSMHNSIELVSQSILQFSSFAEQHSATMQELNAAYSNIADTAHRLIEAAVVEEE